MAGPSTLSRRPVNQLGGVSQTHRDVTDERYRDLRKPRRVRFFCNGDRYFKGKKMFITPHRYCTFNDLLNDLTGKLPSTVHLPYGVRQIYSPTGGSKVRDIEQLQDGENYVVAGFEQFKPIRYGKSVIEPWSHGKPLYRDVDRDLFQRTAAPPFMKAGRPHEHDFYSSATGSTTGLSKGGYGAFQPSRPIRASLQTSRRLPPGTYPGSKNTSHSWSNRAEQANVKPRVITVVRHSHEKPRTNVKILLNRRTVQSYEQMMKDISEAFGPKWRNNRVKKLFSLKGKEVYGVNEFFREDDVFIAVGNESLSSGDIQEVLQELYPDHPQARNLVKDMEKKKRRDRPPLVRTREFDDVKDDATTTSKRDSGFGSDSSNRDEGERDEIYYEGVNSKGKGKKYGHEHESQARIERERQRASEFEREKARKKMQKKLEAEQRALDEERRRKGILPLKPIQERDSFRKIQEQKENERRKKDAERRLREAEERARQEEDARRRKKDEPKVIVVVKEDDKKRGKRSKRSQEDGYETDDDRSHLSPHRNKPTPRSNIDSAFDNYDSEEEREKSRREQEEKDRLQREKEAREKAEQERLEREERERKEKEERERKEREERERKEREERERKDQEERERKEREERERKEQEESEAKERLRKEQEEKDRLAREEQDKERERLEKEKREKEEKERKEKEELLKKKGGKTKMERQISNITHVMDKYEPGRTLGDGNFAIVKQCKLKNPPDGAPSPDFAMKIIDKSKLKGKEQMIENEIEIMRLCDQPNIVKLVDEFETKDEIYLIMELVKGGDLFDAITQSVKFQEATAAHMVADVTNALFYLHSRLIVHRDLKPENLLVCRNRDGSITIKLADFGLAMEVTEPIYTVCGTPTYVAPEILSEIGYGLEVDMWAVGVISYILLCGFPPFRSPDRNQTELFEFIKAGEFEYLSPYWDKISKEAKDLISHLLVVKKSKRYTAIDVLCHPWVITAAGSIDPPPKLEEYRRNLRRDLEIQAKVNREEFLRLYRS